MKKLLLFILLALGGIAPAHAQQHPDALVLTTCGTLPAGVTYAAGQHGILTMDTTGQLCNSSSGGNVTTSGTFTAGNLVAGAGGTAIQDAGLGPTKVINVTDPAYGAKCDNSTDDTVAIQAAITAAVANSNGQIRLVVLPPSICRITATINITGTVAFVGTQYLSALKLDTATPGTDILDVGFQAAQINNVVLQNFTLERAQADSTGIAVNSQSIGGTTYKGLYVFGNAQVGNGFKFVGFQNVALHDVFVNNVIGVCFQAVGQSTNSASVAGPIDSLGAITGGSSYTNGTYFNVPLTGGSGTLALATIVVSGNAVTAVTPTPGTNENNYKPGDTLSAAAANIGGTGSGFSVPVTTVGIVSNDLRIDDLSRCNQGAKGLVVGDWAGGIYVSNTIFYNQTTSAFSQSSTNYWRVASSYHWTSNDIDTTPSAMLWAYAFDAHIVGNRFGYNTTDAINFTGGVDIVVTGNTFVGQTATACVQLGDNSGVNIVKNATVTGNSVVGCHFGVDVDQGATNVDITGNVFSAQTSYNIEASRCNYVNLAIGPNSLDPSQASGPIHYGCVGKVTLVGNAGQKLLGQLRSANFNSSADQAIPIAAQVTAFQVTGISVTNCSVSMTTAVGGFYPTTSKGGTPIVAASQAYSAATSAAVIVPATIAATPLVTRYAISNVYLSLTTPQGATATCDVYIFGNDLS